MFLVLLMEEILYHLVDNLSHSLQGFIHPRWCRISSINTILMTSKKRSAKKLLWPLTIALLMRSDHHIFDPGHVLKEYPGWILVGRAREPESTRLKVERLLASSDPILTKLSLLTEALQEAGLSWLQKVSPSEMLVHPANRSGQMEEALLVYRGAKDSNRGVDVHRNYLALGPF